MPLKKGAWCHRVLVQAPGSCILELVGGLRRGEIGFGRFLRNPAVAVQAMSEAAGKRTGERVDGRDILAIQDTERLFWAVPKCVKLVSGRLAGAAFWVGSLCILFWPLMQ